MRSSLKDMLNNSVLIIGIFFYEQSDTAVSMNVQSAWQAGFTGKGILVAVVDNGVKIDHPDLKSNFVSPT